MEKKFYLICILLGIISTSCETEPIGKADINPETLDASLIESVQLVLQESPEDVPECITFNYSFTLFIFDEEGKYINARSIADRRDFIQFLDLLPLNHTISINYPIRGTLSNGDSIEIDNNDALRDAISNCREQLIKRECDTTFVDCFWKVEMLEDYPNDYEGAYMKADNNGLIELHNKNNVFFGTWVTLFIGEDLYMNIDLNDDDSVEGFWDRNWKVNLLNPTQISLSHEEDRVFLQKDCELDCSAVTFNVCEAEENPGYATFVLQDYTACISVPPTHNLPDAVVYTFHNTREDAVMGINALNPEEYTNLENPETIFVALKNRNTEELLKITEMTIQAIPCP